jgi:glutamate/tyrosine decarboxylase-like PLP-dependent enzyme
VAHRAWDQNAGLYVMSPSASVVEEVAGAWLIDLLGLPLRLERRLRHRLPHGELHGARAARHELLRRAGWDVEADGLQGAPRVRVVVGDEVHVSVSARCGCSDSDRVSSVASPPTIRGG